ncbi:Swi5-dependent recombination DNA repair protein 1 [Colletotrichum chlorophyti]|uniref:Swi5-dependent recombination DNA repair protein 1 n=1 Tax=Colletotrichum chlorophyti TaxID=708187 RepID=A0A1Q8RFG4_9PEZI|nr:Swi5-dependent recombination DNA repair protein 1 [Colletotrichum chlorophyti]
MYTPATKRRRIDVANETLRKPFKSPVVPDPGCIDGAAASESRTPADHGTARTPVRQLSTPTRRPFSVPRRQSAMLPSPLWGDGSSKKVRATRQAEGREEIIRQARRIQGKAEGVEPDGELEALIRKWKDASRLAAEEVFEGSRERVQAMGGLRGLRRAGREKGSGHLGILSGGVTGGGENRDELNGDMDEDGEDGDDKDDEEFTMGTMLKSMNIDFDIIGYDEDTGWWRDG